MGFLAGHQSHPNLLPIEPLHPAFTFTVTLAIALAVTLVFSLWDISCFRYQPASLLKISI